MEDGENEPAKGNGKRLFVAGRPSLDFVNTLVRKDGRPHDLVGTVPALAAWLLEARLVDGAAAQGLRARWRDEGEARAALSRAGELRAHLRSVAEGVLEGVPAEPSLRWLNALLRRNPSYRQVSASEGGYRETVHPAGSDEPWIVALALDAVDLLCRADPTLLRRCEHESCVRLFLDTTKNHKRRWCSVETCGSRAKSAAYYRRKTERARAG